jgi:hypothetical protein
LLNIASCFPGVCTGDSQNAQVAQSVEQMTENPRVDGSIPPLSTINSKAPNCSILPTGQYPVLSDCVCFPSVIYDSWHFSCIFIQKSVCCFDRLDWEHFQYVAIVSRQRNSWEENTKLKPGKS